MRWKQFVAAGFRLEQESGVCRRVKFEALTDNPVSTLAGVLSFVGLPDRDGFCEEAVDRCQLDRLRKSGETPTLPWKDKEPDGFYGRGDPQGWRSSLHRRDVAVIESLVADEMRQFGYAAKSGMRAVGGAIVRSYQILDRSRDLMSRLHRIVMNRL